MSAVEYVSFPIGKDNLFRVYVHCAIWQWGYGGTSDLGICALCYIRNMWGGILTWVYVHCAILVTDLV